MFYHFKIHKDGRGGMWAECLELDGCRAQGDSTKELEKNMKEALDLFLSEPLDSDLVFPLPKKKQVKKMWSPFRLVQG